MTLSRLLLTTSLCAFASLPAFAEGRTFSSIDTNRDGVLDTAELEAAFGAAATATVLAKSDRDGDGAVTRDEIRQSRDDDEDDDEDDAEDDDEDDDRDEDGRDDDEDDDRDDERDDDEDDDRDDDEDDDRDDDEDDDEGDDRDDDEGGDRDEGDDD